MKIKEILESIDSLKTKIYTAYRIYYCSQEIKEAIKQWKMYKDLPVVHVRIENTENNFVEISSYELVNLYGFEELAALLMLDDFEKAQKNNDKEKISDLLAFLVRGKHEVKSKVPQDVFEYIKMKNPEVWTEYENLCKVSTNKDKELEDGYSRIIETDL